MIQALNEGGNSLLIVINEEYCTHPDIMYFIIQYIRNDIDLIQIYPSLRFQLVEDFKRQIKPANMYKFVKKTTPTVIEDNLVIIELSNILRRKLHFCFLLNSWQIYKQFSENYPDLKSIVTPIVINNFEKPHLVHITNQLLNSSSPFKEFGDNEKQNLSTRESLSENLKHVISAQKIPKIIPANIQQNEIGDILVNMYDIIKNQIYQISLTNPIYMKIINLKLSISHKALDINIQNYEFYEGINHHWNTEEIKISGVEIKDTNNSIYKPTLMDNIKIDNTFFSNQKYIQFIRVYEKLSIIITEKFKKKMNHLELMLTNFKNFWLFLLFN